MQAIFRNIQTQLADELGLEKASWRKDWVEAKIILLPGASGLSHLRRQYSRTLYVLLGAVGLGMNRAALRIKAFFYKLRG